jgi:hypothetical protein
MTRTPRECIEATLRNLEMAYRVEFQRSGFTEDALDALAHTAKAEAFSEAIALIRTECQSILEATP